MIKSNKGDQLDTSDYSNKDIKNTKIVDYFDNARRISVEEEPSEIVPKIEISLNECFQKKKSHQATNEAITSANHTQTLHQEHLLPTLPESKSMSLNSKTGEISGLSKPQIEEDCIPSQLIYGQIMPHSSKNKTSKNPNSLKQKSKPKSTPKKPINPKEEHKTPNRTSNKKEESISENDRKMI